MRCQICNRWSFRRRVHFRCAVDNLRVLRPVRINRQGEPVEYIPAPLRIDEPEEDEDS